VVVMSPRPGSIAHIVEIALGERGDATRVDDRFFAAVTAVRSALRGSAASIPTASGMEVGVE
jgi:NitT/TauT family transport system ATP-binding protein